MKHRAFAVLCFSTAVVLAVHCQPAHAGETAIQALIRRLSDPDVEVRKTAARFVRQLSQAALREVIPALGRLAKDENRRLAAESVETLGKLGPDAVPALIEALKDQRPDVRAAAVSALRGAGPAAKDAVPLLIAALNDANEKVRWDAVAALGTIGPAAEAALAPLSALLAAGPPKEGADARQSVPFRALVAETLGLLGAKAVAPLTKTLEDPVPEMRAAAAAALAKLGPAAQEAVPALLQKLKDT
ncbi:MAG: HEAT repeat domain-containing protein, partial [Planctomycetota bacterium]|nr:HEAT repeat domain-containing protein [Planctomycetota bacterium]